MGFTDVGDAEGVAAVAAVGRPFAELFRIEGSLWHIERGAGNAG